MLDVKGRREAMWLREGAYRQTEVTVRALPSLCAVALQNIESCNQSTQDRVPESAEVCASKGLAIAIAHNSLYRENTYCTDKS